MSATAAVRAMGFPGRYLQGPGALHTMGPVLRDLGATRACAIFDPAVASLLAPQVGAALESSGIAFSQSIFPGETTRANIALLSETVRAQGAQAVVAVGGGKTIDTTKGVARQLGLPIVICPTAASSDAPTSRLIVLYDEAHRVVGVDYLPRNPDAVIVDTEVIVAAPARLFAAGIGDAISKRYEAAQCALSGGNNSFGTPPLTSALLLADQTYATLLRHGAAAYQDVRGRRLTDTVERVVEATVLLSGIGFESGGLSLAHALVRGLTAIPAMASMLHGEIVAFGTLVQTFVENRPHEEIEALATLLLAVGLPVSLAGLGQHEALTAGQKLLLVEATLGTGYSRNMRPALTGERLLDGLKRADEYGSKRLHRHHEIRPTHA